MASFVDDILGERVDCKDDERVMMLKIPRRFVLNLLEDKRQRLATKNGKKRWESDAQVAARLLANLPELIEKAKALETQQPKITKVG